VATLFVFAGLPGTGKSTLARMLSDHRNCTFLRIDTIEQSLRDLCSLDVEGEGYRLAYRLAADNLRIGHSVVADSCNPLRLTRNEWLQVAEDVGCRAVNIEVVCSNADEHRRRIEERDVDVPGLVLPTWDQVRDREYHPWDMDRIVVDTAGSEPTVSFRYLLDHLGEQGV